MRVRVTFEAVSSYDADLDYQEYVDLLSQEDDPEVPLLSRQQLREGPWTGNVWAGSELGERLWNAGIESDSGETRVTRIERIKGDTEA